QGYAEQAKACLNEVPNWIPPEAVFGWHIVKKGETLGLIARRYRTTVQAIVRLNNLRSSTLIYPGQKLKIPGRVQGLIPAEEESLPVSSPTSPANYSDKTITYVVKAGDTLFQISKTYGISLEKIKKDNNLASDDLTPGQKLILRLKD
ncbi:MAG: LysM peptidoglycan-binding domain-containing protein, partial [Candidatus Saccharicenans sp.]